MTVSAQTPYSSQAANGVTTAFPFAYKIRKNTDIVVTLVDGSSNETVQTLGVHYTVAGVGAPTGGTVNFTAAPADGDTVKTRRATAATRSTDYQNNGDFLAAVVNDDVDAVWLAIQDLLAGTQAAGNIMRAPVGESLPVLAPAALRKDRFLGFDATTGMPEASSFTMSLVANALIAAHAAGASTLTVSAFELLTDAQKADVSGNVGAIDVTAAIQQAIDLLANTPYGGKVELARGTWLLSSASLKLARGVLLVGAGKDATILKISGDHAGIEQKLLAGGTVGAQNVGAMDLQILGTGDATKTNQHGLVCSSSLQYSAFHRILIKDVGANGLHAPVTPLGAIFNSFRDIEIINPRGYGHFFAGNYGQNVHERVRIFGGYSHGFVTDGTLNVGSNPISNTFIGCAYESTNNTTTDVYGFYAVSDAIYNAYDTTCINCYFEPMGRSVGDTTGYRLGAVKGFNIIGGIINFCHWAVVAKSQYSEGIQVVGVTFVNSPTWPGSANLVGKAMLSCTDPSARIHVGPQCSAHVTGGVTWATTDTGSAGRIHGFLNLQDKLNSGKELTFSAPMDSSANRPNAVASRAGEFFLTMGAAGFADHLDVCIKRADDTYAWVPVGNQSDYKGTFAFPGVTVGAGASLTGTVPIVGAALGRYLRVAAPIDIGMGMSWTCSSAGNGRYCFTNPTGAPITLPAGTWDYMVQG